MIRLRNRSQPRGWNTLFLFFAAVFLLWTPLSLLKTRTYLSRGKHAPSVHLVLATDSSNDYHWTRKLTLENYEVIPYVFDDQNATYHFANKGNEAMGYLTYMYEFYDKLPDISIFLHGHDIAWHVDDVLHQSTAETLNLLDLDEVRRRKYMNLRISSAVGCPGWTNTSFTIESPERGVDKPEQVYMKDAFQALFPGDPVPEILGVPCCSQLAATRETIRAVPRERYLHAMNWLQKSELPSSITGRIWEHLWQWLFLHKAIDCEPEHVVLCRAYHICFESDEWEHWNKLQEMLREGLVKQRAVATLASVIDQWKKRAILAGQSETRRMAIAANEFEKRV